MVFGAITIRCANFKGARNAAAARPGARPADQAMRSIVEFDRLVLPVFIKRRSPDLVRRLVFGTAKTKRHAKTEIEQVDQPFSIELRSGTLEPLDQR
jgi:hypothetical protein